jgi:hypothetical protein
VRRRGMQARKPANQLAAVQDLQHRDQGAAQAAPEPAGSASPRHAALEERTGWERLESRLFVAAVLLQLVPLVVLPHLGTQDGPAHLSTAVALADYGSPAHPIFRAVYSIDRFPSPNLLIQVLLTALVRLTSPEAAEKLLVGAYLVAFPLAWRLAVRQLDRRATWLSFAALPLTANHMFLSGFYNFGYGLVAFLLGAALLLSPRPRSPLRFVAGLGLWLLLAYFAHLIPALGLALLAGTVAATPVLTAAWERSRPSIAGILGGPVSYTAAATVPFALLTLLFVARTGLKVYNRENPLKLLFAVPTLVLPMVGYSWLELIPTLLLAAFVILLAVLFLRQQRLGAFHGRHAALALAFVVAYLLCVIAPGETAQGAAINTRLSLFPPLFLLLWLSGFRPSRRLRVGAVAVFLVAAGGLAVLRLPTQLRHDRDVDAYVQASHLVQPGSTIVGVQLVAGDRPVRTFSDATLHAPSLVAALRHSVDVGNYQPLTSYFPIRFWPDANLRQQIDPLLLPGGRGGGGLEETPPDVDLLRPLTVHPTGDRARRQERIDYVLVRGDLADVPPEGRARAERLLAQLRASYRLLGSFSGSLPLRLYGLR